MPGDIEAIGDVATGAVVGSALGSDAGNPGDPDAELCANCGSVISTPYCPQCGQRATLHRTLTAFGHDILHSVLHFDGKIWRTLPMLALRPGQLTFRYIHGERAKFVSPLALFLFSVFLMFAVMGLIGTHLEAPKNMQLGPGSEASKEVQRSAEALRKELAAIDQKIVAAEAKGQSTGELKRERANVAGIVRIVEGGPSVIAKEKGTTLNLSNTGWTRLDEGIQKARENPNLLLYKLQTNAYKFSWALIPLSIPFVWLLFFWRRQFKMYDHAIFVTYSLAFMTLFSVLLIILNAAGMQGGATTWAFFLIAPVHIFFQMKGAYRLSTISALLRTFVLLIMTIFILVIFLLLLLMLGVIG